MKIDGVKIILKCGRCRDGEVKEKILRLDGKKLEPYKRERMHSPHPYEIHHYKLGQGKYLLIKEVYTKNRMYGILQQIIEINESGIHIISEEHKGKLPANYVKHISVP